MIHLHLCKHLYKKNKVIAYRNVKHVKYNVTNMLMAYTQCKHLCLRGAHSCYFNNLITQRVVNCAKML